MLKLTWLCYSYSIYNLFARISPILRACKSLFGFATAAVFYLKRIYSYLVK
jgi:hypothetical protein